MLAHTAWVVVSWQGRREGHRAQAVVSNVVSAQVITPSAGGPAERAGIAPRDVLLAIGERATSNISLYEAGDLLQGTEGTEVCRLPPSHLPSLSCLESSPTLCLALLTQRLK